MKLESTRGHTTFEYALFIGVFLVFAIGSITLLGRSITDLFSSLTSSSTQNSMTAYMNVTLGSKGAGASKGLPSNGPANGSFGNTNGLLTGLSPVAVNVSSVDGTGLHYVQTTLTYAQRLQQLADDARDPDIKGQLEKIAQDAYWIGGSQATYEYHQNGNTSLADLSKAMIDKDTRDPEIANRALISIHDNENFLTGDLQALLNMPGATAEQKAFAQSIANQVLSKSQVEYQASYNNLINSNTSLPDAGLRTSVTVDSATGKTAKELVMQIGDSLISAGGANNTPAVKTSLVDGHDTHDYAQGQ